MQTNARYPSPQHARASEAILNRYSEDPDVEAVLLVNSCARGKASLDMAVLRRLDRYRDARGEEQYPPPPVERYRQRAVYDEEPNWKREH
jgi:hypothetical protein